MAFISEIHYQNTYAAGSANPEFVEITISPGDFAHISDFQVVTYQSDGTVRETFNLSSLTPTIDPVSGYRIYTMDTLVTNPDHLTGSNEAEAVALIDNSLANPVVAFYDIGGGTTAITATEGPALGATSVNISPPSGGQSIQWDIWGTRTDGPHTEGSSVVCFAAGTMIRTPQGPMPIETLCEDDGVVTQNNGTQNIRWIGKRTVTANEMVPQFSPVCIKANAIKSGVPNCDLRVSQQHRILIESPMFDLYFGTPEFLVKAKDIAQMYENVYIDTRIQTITYYHLFFDQHEVLFANDCPSESFYPGAQALKSINQTQLQELYALFPQLELNDTTYSNMGTSTLKNWEVTALPQT